MNNGSKVAEMVLPYSRFLATRLRLPAELLTVIDVVELGSRIKPENTPFPTTYLERFRQRNPPAAAPTPAPASAAIIGPAATKGPRPGIANVPIRTSHPATPPRTPPVAAPVAAPSGALVC